MSRYRNIPVRILEGREYRKNALYPDIPVSENDYYVISTVGDRFDILAQQFYNDVNLWWIIAAANPNVRRDTLFITPGLQLRIPIDPVQVERSVTRENNQ